MKVNELQISDFVLYNDNICIVDEIRVDNTVVLTALNTDVTSIDGDQVSVDEIKPIPFTAEILEKNGFIGGEYKSYTGYVWYLEEKGFRKIWFIMSCEKSILCGEKIKANGSIGDNFSIPNIKFVHELQHALRLCNIEKEIIV